MSLIDRFTNWLESLNSTNTTSAEYNYPITKTGGKIGIHSLQPAESVNYTRQLNQNGGRFPVVKAVDNIDWLADIKTIDPEIITIARFEIPGNIGEGVNGIQYVEDGDYSHFVDTLFAPIQVKLRERPDFLTIIDYWEICNEPDPPGADGWRKLAECISACIERANEMGIKLAIFALNAGTPEWWELEAIVETGVFGAAKAGGHIMTCHEAIFGFENGAFNNPVDLWYGHPIPVNQEGTRWVQVREDGLHYFNFDANGQDQPDWWDKGIAGPLLYRYRFLYALLHERDEVIPLVISEIVYGGNYSDVPDVRSRVEWYDEKSADDYYVLAHLPFTLGGYGYGWDKQDYAYAYPTFIDYMTVTRNRPNADQPLVTTPKSEFKLYAPVISKFAISNRPPAEIDRIIVVNLLPSVATIDEKLQVIEASHVNKEGIMQSAEDARTLVGKGIFGSHVNAWEPWRWDGNLRNYMAENYVDTEYLVLNNSHDAQPVSTLDGLIRPLAINLLPPAMTIHDKRIVVYRTHQNREPIMQSADDAISLAKIGGPTSVVNVWQPEGWAGDILAYLRNNQVTTNVMTLDVQTDTRAW